MPNLVIEKVKNGYIIREEVGNHQAMSVSDWHVFNELVDAFDHIRTIFKDEK